MAAIPRLVAGCTLRSCFSAATTGNAAVLYKPVTLGRYRALTSAAPHKIALASYNQWFSGICRRPVVTEFTIMPIYEYACPECGAQNEHMQKLADAPIVRAACGQQVFQEDFRRWLLR